MTKATNKYQVLKCPQYQAGNPLSASSLCLVHTTGHKPSYNNGAIEIHTPSTFTKGDYFKPSKHFSLNHRVANHGDNQWNDSPYTIIADFDLALENNGRPETLNPVDVFWVRGIGEPMILQHASLVSPGVSKEELFEFTPEGAIYKSSNFTVANMVELLTGIESLFADPESEMRPTSRASLHITVSITEELLHLNSKNARAFLLSLWEIHLQDPSMDIKRTLEKLASFGINALEHFDKVEAILSEGNHKRTVEKLIHHKGYQVVTGRTYGVTGIREEAFSELAKELNVPLGTSTHFNTLRKIEHIVHILDTSRRELVKMVVDNRGLSLKNLWDPWGGILDKRDDFFSYFKNAKELFPHTYGDRRDFYPPIEQLVYEIDDLARFTPMERVIECLLYSLDASDADHMRQLGTTRFEPRLLANELRIRLGMSSLNPPSATTSQAISATDLAHG